MSDVQGEGLMLTGAEKQALRRAARHGEYHLMLGAGASRESRSKEGSQLPGSVGLIKELCARFGVESEEDDLLWRIYDRATSKVGADEVYRWLRQRFWNVRHPYWMEYYARGPWSSVWTLNIDDTFEAAYRGVATETSKKLEVLNWDDDYRHSRNLSVIHLHGVVDRDEPRQLVFSLAEYANSASASAAWPTNFRDTYGNSPFVILGARLRDEPDIEAVISRRNPVHPAPSFYVSRTISSTMRADLERWGLTPVEMTAEDFVLEWSRLTGLDLEGGIPDEVELGIRVGQQFSELRDSPKPELEDGHDFLGGDEPLWSDIQNDQATELEWVTHAQFDLNQVGQSIPSCTLLAYTGRRLSGRSTGLLQLGARLRKAAWRTFLFQSTGRLDIDAILGYASSGKSIALLFDGVADVADDVDKLLTESRAAGLSVLCVAVEDSAREANIVGRLQSVNLGHGRVAAFNGRLTGVDATRLVDHLSGLGRLGILEDKSDKIRVQHFRHSDLFDAMAELENAPGFGRRVDDLTKGLGTAAAELVIVAAYASYVSHQLLVVDAARVLGVDSDNLVQLLTSDVGLNALLSTDGSVVRTRHRWMALSPLVKSLGSAAALDAIGRAIRRVSGRVSQQSLRERNPTALLVGALMKQRNLRVLFPGASLDPWYGSLIDIFGTWSGRYWEQRAILARWDSKLDIALLARAESYALRASELVPDTYSFTTLGTVLLEKATRASVDIQLYYERAYTAFERAGSWDRGEGSLVTWIAYLRYAIRFMSRLTTENAGGVGSLQLLERVRDDWIRVYTQLAVMRDSSERVARDLASLSRAYDDLGLATRE